MAGYIKLFRSIVDWEWYRDANTTRLFLHLLLTANHADKRWQGIEIKAGQLVTSLPSLSEQTGLSIRSIRTSLQHLKSTGELTDQSTSKYRLITIANWASYQIESNEATGKPTGKRQATDRQPTANKNDKKEKNEKNIYGEQKNVLLTEDEFNKLASAFPNIYLDCIEFLSSYIVEKNYKSESHYLAIRRWVKDAVKQKPKEGVGSQYKFVD